MEMSQDYLTAVGKEINQRVIIGEMLVCTALVSHYGIFTNRTLHDIIILLSLPINRSERG